MATHLDGDQLLVSGSCQWQNRLGRPISRRIASCGNVKYGGEGKVPNGVLIGSVLRQFLVYWFPTADIFLYGNPIVQVQQDGSELILNGCDLFYITILGRFSASWVC